MTLKKIAFSFVFMGIFALPTSLLAQGEPEDIAAVTDEFQDYFYESLKQKGIENYDLAVKSLEKCLTLQPNNPVVHYEIGKNALAKKDYTKAYDAFDKATKIDPTNLWYWVGLYDVCYATQNYGQAIVIVNKLIEFNKEYKEDLTSLYMNTFQFDKALELIDELNETVGKSEMRENYKAQIMRDSKYQAPLKDKLLDLIKKNPKDESNYIQLIYLYSESNQEEKAMEIAKQLEKQLPDSDWAQVSLFKFHLNNNDGANAVKSMNKVFTSAKIDKKIKHRVMNEFLIFAKDQPQYEPDLEKAVAYFTGDEEVAVAKEIGKFYQSKKLWDNAAKYYEMHLKNNPDDIEATLLLLETDVARLQFDAVGKKAEAMIDLYPLQPQFYYYAGLANNQIKNYKKAKDFLEMGMDYLVDDIELETNFNIQLGEAYSGLGDIKKKEAYFLKAESLLKKQKKK